MSRHLLLVSRMPSSAHIRFRGKEGGRWTGRSDDNAQGSDLLYANIMHPFPLCANVAGMRASGNVASVVDVVLCALKCV